MVVGWRLVHVATPNLKALTSREEPRAVKQVFKGLKRTFQLFDEPAVTHRAEGCRLEHRRSAQNARQRYTSKLTRSDVENAVTAEVRCPGNGTDQKTVVLLDQRAARKEEQRWPRRIRE